jgi:hypothetical protein
MRLLLGWICLNAFYFNFVSTSGVHTSGVRTIDSLWRDDYSVIEDEERLVQMHICIYVRVYRYAYTNICIYIFIYTYIHIYLCVYSNRYMHVCMHVY